MNFLEVVIEPEGIKIEEEKVKVVLDWLVSKLLWQLLITITNSSITSKSLSRISSRNYKRTQQEVSDVLLPYLYYGYMVYANNK